MDNTHIYIIGCAKIPSSWKIDETEIIVLVEKWLKRSALLESVMQNIGKDTD